MLCRVGLGRRLYSFFSFEGWWREGKECACWVARSIAAILKHTTSALGPTCDNDLQARSKGSKGSKGLKRVLEAGLDGAQSGLKVGRRVSSEVDVFG